jgi:hypothetical protein
MTAITTYIIIGAIFGLTCTWCANRISKMDNMPPQTLKEFGWVEHLILILLWPLCLLIILLAAYCKIRDEFKNGKNK